MESIRLEINHGGQFKTNEGIYYYTGGTSENIYNVDIRSLSVETLLKFLKEIGYGDGLKLYYKPHKVTGKEGYKLIWNLESIKDLQEVAKTGGFVNIYVDHCGEEKRKNVVEERMNIAGEGNEVESDDPDYEDDEYSDSEEEDELESDDDNVQSDVDDELEAIREKKKMLREGKIDPLKEGNLTEMHIGNGSHNVPIETTYDTREQHERHEAGSKRKHDGHMGEIPEWSSFVQYEYKQLAEAFPKFNDNNDIGVDKVGKMVDENEDSDSFDVLSMESSDTSDNEDVVSTRKNKKNQQPNYPTFNPNTSIEHIEFEPGMIFTSREQLKEAIRNYAVAKQRRVFIKRNDFKRMQAKCREGCKWELWASRLNNDEAFQIKTYKRQHNCIIMSKQRMVKSDWLAKKFGSTIRSNPRWKLKDFAEAINQKYKLICTINQCWWAKKIAMSELESVLQEHYGRLWDYGAEILRTNPGSSVFIKGEVTTAHSSVEQGQKKRRVEHVNSSAEPPSTPTHPPAQQPAQPKKRGRPPKAAPQVKKVNKPSGVGVFLGDDGHTYLSSSATTLRVTSSQPNSSSHGAATSSSRPTRNPQATSMASRKLLSMSRGLFHRLTSVRNNLPVVSRIPAQKAGIFLSQVKQFTSDASNASADKTDDTFLEKGPVRSGLSFLTSNNRSRRKIWKMLLSRKLLWFSNVAMKMLNRRSANWKPKNIGVSILLLLRRWRENLWNILKYIKSCQILSRLSDSSLFEGVWFKVEKVSCWT
ncbi:hypothetical protein POM88_045957 [Heracleum sosnowskyi]|uniref:Transposase MuDR plant domain-containing protein n=1 Tax=Heracleum sosnowskyi TaxID=360622 RepID=A0AAD8H890_9APIA|nr:hypothetical protein POM88_045957 [Heracleum sosnowskyi]